MLIFNENRIAVDSTSKITGPRDVTMLAEYGCPGQSESDPLESWQRWVEE
jgi:hypothetical protein